jgi:HAD superfamily phosphatase
MPLSASPPRAVVLFDIDGVIRDVSASYRRAIVETVHHFHGQRPEPAAIDGLKSEGLDGAAAPHWPYPPAGV